jgi:hypothetical protein
VHRRRRYANTIGGSSATSRTVGGNHFQDACVQPSANDIGKSLVDIELKQITLVMEVFDGIAQYSRRIGSANPCFSR